MPQAPDQFREFASLVKIVELLRGPEGCPWDKEQTHQTLTRFAIEEAHELAVAIDRGNLAEMKEELGDLLLQVVIHAEMARQNGQFDIYDVIEGIGRKMVRRHPHVFANVQVADSAEVLDNWAKIKAQEKAQPNPWVRFDLPPALPALISAQKVGEKTKKWHFDWQTPEEVLKKVEEELEEVKVALRARDQQALEHEIGDLLFSVAQLGRHLNIDGEQALRVTNLRFEERFVKMQQFCHRDGKDFAQLTSAELENYWQQAKLALTAK